MDGKVKVFVFGCCPRGWETQCGASSCAMIAGCGCRTYIQRQACTHRKSGAAHRTPFFCKSLSCTKHHAACQASCASFTQTSRMRWECGRVAAASVSALSLFPAACSTAVLCYHPPRAFFFLRYHSSANLTAVRPVVLLLVACCLLLAAPLSHLHSHFLLSHSLAPLTSRVCACWGFLHSAVALCYHQHCYYVHLSPPPITHPPNAPVIALPTFVASRVCLSFLRLLPSKESDLVCCSVRTGR